MTIKKLTTKEILSENLARHAPPAMQQLIIVLHNVRSMHNVGAAFRNADAFGIRQIIISGFTPAPPRREITKTAIGAEEFVDWRESKDIHHLLQQLKDDGYIVLGLEQTHDSILLPDYSIPPNKKICLLFGNEVTGIDEEMLPAVGQFLEIPQYGHKHSLNVSVTVGIALYAFLQKYWTE